MDIETLEKILDGIKSNQEALLQSLNKLENKTQVLTDRLEQTNLELQKLYEDLVSTQTMVEEILFHVAEPQEEPTDTESQDSIGFIFDISVNNSKKNELN